MADEATTATVEAPTRRGFLKAIGGGLAALGLRSLVSPGVAHATDGQSVIMGQANHATNVTGVDATNSLAAFVAQDTSSGTGLEGVTFSGTGSTAPGLLGIAESDLGIGVVGESQGQDGIGVMGTAGGPSSSGVWGSGNIGVYGTSATGAGVFGESTTAGAVGVIAKADVVGGAPGVALRVEGFPQFFTTAGRATVATGKKQVTVSLAGVVPTDTVLATVQASNAFSVKNAKAGTGTFTITITKAATSPVSVGYLVLRT